MFFLLFLKKTQNQSTSTLTSGCSSHYPPHQNRPLWPETFWSWSHRLCFFCFKQVLHPDAIWKMQKTLSEDDSTWWQQPHLQPAASDSVGAAANVGKRYSHDLRNSVPSVPNMAPGNWACELRMADTNCSSLGLWVEELRMSTELLLPGVWDFRSLGCWQFFGMCPFFRRSTA